MDKLVKFFDKFIDSALENPEIYPNKVLITNIETFSKILTPARIEIIEIIKKTKPKNIDELAKNLDVPLESVSRDLKVLENYGVLDFIRGGKTKKPKIEKEMILIPLNY